MGKKIKFPLILKDNHAVRTIEELREFIDVEKLYENFFDGKLVTWLQDRYYTKEAKLIQEIATDDSELLQRLFEILEIKRSEDISDPKRDLKSMEQYYRKLNILKQIVDDELILSSVEQVAFNQEDLKSIIESGNKTIYLFNDSFSISVDTPVDVLIGIGNKVSLTVDDLEDLRKIDIQNIPVYCHGKLVSLEEEMADCEYFIETCYDYDGSADKILSLEDGTLYTSKYNGLYQRNKETGEKRLISREKLDVKEFVCFKTGICYQIVDAGDCKNSKIFYYDLKDKNIEIWEGEYNRAEMFGLFGRSVLFKYESDYVIWNAVVRGKGTTHFYNTMDLSLQNIGDSGGHAEKHLGRALLQDNFIYSESNMALKRFEIKTGKIVTIMEKADSYRIYGNVLYIEDNDNFYKVNQQDWKPIILSPKYAKHNSSFVKDYFAHGNQFIWIVEDIFRGITIRVLDMHLHKIMNIVKYTRSTKISGDIKVKMQEDFIYISQSFFDDMEFKKVNKQTGLVEDISKEDFEDASDVLIDKNLLWFGKTK